MSINYMSASTRVATATTLAEAIALDTELAPLTSATEYRILRLRLEEKMSIPIFLAMACYTARHGSASLQAHLPSTGSTLRDMNWNEMLEVASDVDSNRPLVTSSAIAAAITSTRDMNAATAVIDNIENSIAVDSDIRAMAMQDLRIIGQAHLAPIVMGGLHAQYVDRLIDVARAELDTPEVIQGLKDEYAAYTTVHMEMLAESIRGDLSSTSVEAVEDRIAVEHLLRSTFRRP